MAELIITDEERKTLSYLDWDDASLGRAVKKIAMKIEDTRGENSISWCAGAMALMARAIDTGSDHSVMTVEGLVDDGRHLGDWEVAVRKIARPLSELDECPDCRDDVDDRECGDVMGQGKYCVGRTLGICRPRGSSSISKHSARGRQNAIVPGRLKHSGAERPEPVNEDSRRSTWRDAYQ